MTKKGKLIVIYGANNLGKSLQTELLVNDLQQRNIPVKRVKYPLYTLAPTGPLINAILRGGKKLPEDEVQKLYVQNRKDYEPDLKKDLRKGIWVIAEDYIGTGIVWGMARGLQLEFLEKINQGLHPEDVAFVFYGKRFYSGKETNHRNETDDQLWQKANDLHLQLADRYGWIKILANREPEKIHEEILRVLIAEKIIAIN